MKIIFHEQYHTVYSSDPAAEKGRIAAIEQEIRPYFDFITPHLATEQQILLNHSPDLVHRIKQKQQLYDIVLLAAGGAITAAELAMKQEPTFALIRPPGHHASYDSCWGFCYFNNIAIAIKHLCNLNEIKSALIIDFDLHLGDGTKNAFKDTDSVRYYHVSGNSETNFIGNMKQFLETSPPVDILGVSAGFDRGLNDWGDLISKRGYVEIGLILKHFSERKSHNRRFAVLEGGYNHDVIGKHVLAFLNGFK